MIAAAPAAIALLLVLGPRAAAGCDCSYPRAPPGGWANGSVLDLRQSVAEADFDEVLLARLHSNQTTHTEGGRERPMYAPPITTQVAFWFAPSRISPLPCSDGSRGEDSAILRTFFFDALHRPLLSADATFVEIGANDGMLESTTLFFERCLGWPTYGLRATSAPTTSNSWGAYMRTAASAAIWPRPKTGSSTKLPNFRPTAISNRSCANGNA